MPLDRNPAPRNPDTFFLYGLLALSGYNILSQGANPDSINALVSPWQATAWAAALTFGSSCTFVGTLWGLSTKALLVEALGRLVLSLASLLYMVAVLESTGEGARVVAALLLALSWACGWRMGQIGVTLWHRRKRSGKPTRQGVVNG